MTIEATILLSGVSVAGALYFGQITKIRNEKNDAAHEQKEEIEKANRETEMNTRILTKLDTIGGDIKEVKAENRNMREDVGQLRERVARCEASIKSYHKRLDEEQSNN